MGVLDGMVALVTGAASRRGIGRGIALALADAGADLAVSDIGRRSLVARAEPAEWQGLDSLVAEVEALGRRAVAVVADLGVSEEVDRLVSETLAWSGRVDILVNNAAAPQEPTVDGGWELPEAEWNQTLAVNLTAPFLLCRRVIPQML